MDSLSANIPNLVISGTTSLLPLTVGSDHPPKVNIIRVVNVPKEQIYTVQFTQLDITKEEKERLVNQFLRDADAAEGADIRWPTPHMARISTRKLFHDFTKFTKRDYPLPLVANGTLHVVRERAHDVSTLYIYKDGNNGRRVFGQLERKSGRSAEGCDKYKVVSYSAPTLSVCMIHVNFIEPHVNVCDFLQGYFGRKDFYRLAQKEDSEDAATRGRVANQDTDIKNARELLQVLVGLKVYFTYQAGMAGRCDYSKPAPAAQGWGPRRIITLGLSATRQKFRYEVRTETTVKTHYNTFSNLKNVLPEGKLSYPDLPVAIVGYRELENAAGARNPICLPLECLTIAPEQGIMKGLNEIYVTEQSQDA